jgi:hypothetical protein
MWPSFAAPIAALGDERRMRAAVHPLIVPDAQLFTVQPNIFVKAGPGAARRGLDYLKAVRPRFFRGCSPQHLVF